MMNKTLIGIILVIASPILFTLVIFPDTFNLSWNQGRGGFLFALAFIVAEIIGIKGVISSKKIFKIIPLAIITIAYIASLKYGLSDILKSASVHYNVQLDDSWVLMWDFIIMTMFVIGALAICFGKKWIRIAPAGPIFLAGSAIILSLDAFFPYDTLGPLQIIVPHLVEANAAIISALDLGTAIARDNLLILRGDHGPFVLEVFWPSAGVHSIIIYSLVMMAFLLKMNIPRQRKAIYFVLGVGGTIFVNLIRIFSLAVYALKVTTNGAQWEEFHSVAGEIMFLPWLFIFLLVIARIETKRIKNENIKNKLKD